MGLWGLECYGRWAAGGRAVQVLKVAAWPVGVPSGEVRFQTVAWWIWKRWPVEEMRMPE